MQHSKVFWMSLGLLFVFGQPAQADFFDKLEQMMDRVTDRAEQKAEDRMNEAADDAVDNAFESTEEAVECAVTDKDCREEEQKKSAQPQKAKKPSTPKKVQAVHTESASTSMKCTMTDVACLKEAKALGKPVEIVDEQDLDVIRCQVTNVDCLQRAKELGKPVEIID